MDENSHINFNIMKPKQKRPPLCWRWFQIHFLLWKLLYFDSNVTEICCEVFNYQNNSIDLDNGLALIRRQAVIWNNDVLVHWRMYELFVFNMLVIYNIVIQSLGRNWSKSTMYLTWHNRVPCMYSTLFSVTDGLFCFGECWCHTKGPRVTHIYVSELGHNSSK